MKRKLFTLLISAVLVVAMLPAWCWADVAAGAETVLSSEPMSEAALDSAATTESVTLSGECESELDSITSETLQGSKPARLLGASSATLYSSKTDVAKLIRKAMKEHKSSVTFRYNFTSKDIKAYVNDFFNDVIDKAVAHTGDPTEGEYLRWQHGTCSYTANITTPSDKPTSHKMTMTISIPYYTTLSEESQTAAKCEEILASIGVADKTDYEIVRAVYDYLTENVAYDNEAVVTEEAKAYTAYAAAIRGKATCQGYALLMYRLLNECGISCRLYAATKGTNKTADGHAWNLVKLGGKYYFADSTWDVGFKDNYRYFLMGRQDFVKHGEYTHVYDYIKGISIAECAYNGESEEEDKEPAPTKLTSVSGGKKRITVKWTKTDENVNGYQIQYSTSSKFKKAKKKMVYGKSTGKVTIKKLKAKKKYYARIRVFKVVGGKYYYSDWSTKKSGKTKK